ncbi:serine/threonine protein kinase [Kutzneria kofuensis]|uniref:non-specific serine/threonine protein kinase n=1 Tax=Kutzneria kofuensis TaxID=103725 RepID=A0A7W9KQU8_9PSEU|nr:protein kinase [Kutzneria kofuensis]MBB5896748.1 hypothetical protein [Kutzneria kofuensis]
MSDRTRPDDGRAQPGWYVGDGDNPDTYRLEEPVGRGGEGEVWRATSVIRNGDRLHWAVKILHAENLETGLEESMADALERWYQRAHHTLQVTGQLQVEGVVGATMVFKGPRPHPPGEAGRVRTLYVLSPWVDGADLTGWLKRDPTFPQVCAVAAQLAGIVDGLATSRIEIAHRDISPANVLVEAGTDRVHLIDFTFAVPLHSGLVTTIQNKGYTAPEALVGRGSPEADRYSFGGVVFYLLTGRNPEVENAAAECFDQLVRASRPAALARHVSALLSADPHDRPACLVDWVAELAELGTATPTGLRYADLHLSVDGFRTATITAIRGTTLARARLGPASLQVLVADADAPHAPVLVRSVTDGAGNTVEFAIDKAERLMVGRAGAWTAVGRAAVDAGLAVVRTATGSARAYLVDPVRDRMSTVDTAVDGEVRCSGAGAYLRRVLAATVDHDGVGIVAALSHTSELVILTDDDPERLHRLSVPDVRSAALGLNTWGEPVCFAAGAGSRELAVFEQHYGQWLATGTVAAPDEVGEVACVGQRDGLTLAVGGPGGLWTRTRTGEQQTEWQQLADRHCHRVALDVGAAWRVQLAAIVDGQVVVATEDFDGQWSTTVMA